MPLYDYRCTSCDHVFEARHSIAAAPPLCPVCEQPDPQRMITSVPHVAKGMAASLAPNATKDQLQEKWAEETPKLREKLVSKLGEETVNRHAPTLNTRYE